ncbi:MAG: UbiA family prenyltransferase [Thermoplasmata archaeon]
MASVHPLLRIVRVGNTGVSFAGTVVGGLDAAGASAALYGTFWVPVLLAAASTACVTAAGNILNDLGDLDTDRRNHPDRPLVTGELTPNSARRLMIVLFVTSFALIAPILLAHPALAPIWLAAIGALLAYELRWKADGLAGNALVAFLTAAVFLYGAASQASLLPVVSLALMAFFATLSREVIKDMEDAEGDVGRATLPRTHGLGVSAGMARLAVAVAIVLSPVPLLGELSLGSAAGIMYLALVAATDAVFVASVLSLPERLHRSQTLSKGAMTVALLAFLAFAFRGG